jgi:hypothetical protein
VAALSAQAIQPADELALEPDQPLHKPLLQSAEPEASSVAGAAMLGETGFLIDQIGAPVVQPASFFAPAH